ncbi:MAG: hypothetical protein ACOH12_05650 [Parvibaculaceae bacterium]
MASDTGRTTMARKIFYARRSKRPLFLMLGLLGLTVCTFYAGYEAGRSVPDMYASSSASEVVVAER